MYAAPLQYHHIDIAPIHHKYLGFTWEQKFYVFIVLPFGLCTACYLFTKVVRPLVRYWRSQGLRVVMYLYDGLGAASGFDAACKGSLLVRTTLESAGFIVHPTKCMWNPSQRVIWLGFAVDLALGQIHVPESKIAGLHKMIEQAKVTSFVRPRYLASMLGKTISMSLAFGPVSRFMTRSLYAVLESRQSWSELLQFSQDAKS